MESTLESYGVRVNLANQGTAELCCPYCGKKLTSNEYERALHEFKGSAEQEYKKQFLEYKRQLQDQLIEEEKRHRLEMESLKRTHTEEIEVIGRELKITQDKQVGNLEKRYSQLNKQREQEVNQKMEQVLASHERDIKEKERLIQIIQKDQAQIREQASEQAKAAARNEILQREEQIRRFKEKVEMLERQLTLTQSELKGEVGEKDLLNSLTEAFREEGDVFTRQTRGISEEDILHKVEHLLDLFLKLHSFMTTRRLLPSPRKMLRRG